MNINVQTPILTSKGYYPIALLKQGTPIIIYDNGFKSIPLEFGLDTSDFERVRLHQEDEVKWNGKWIPGGGFSQWLTLASNSTIYTKSGYVSLLDKPKEIPIFDIRMLNITQTHNLEFLNEDASIARIKKNVKQHITANYKQYEVEKLSRIYSSDVYKYRRGRIKVSECRNLGISKCVKVYAPNVIIHNLIIGNTNED